MEDIFVRGLSLPGKVRGVTVKIRDDFVIFIKMFRPLSMRWKQMRCKIRFGGKIGKKHYRAY